MSRIHNTAVINIAHYMKTLYYLEDFSVAGLKLDHRHFGADFKEQIWKMRDTINWHLNETDGLSGLSVEGVEIEAGPVGENLAKFWRSSSRSDQLLDRRTLCGRQQLLVQGSRTNCAAAIHKSRKNREERPSAELLDQKLLQIQLFRLIQKQISIRTQRGYKIKLQTV